MMILAAITTLLLLAITLGPLLPSNHWIVRDWEFPRVQISALLVANSLFVVICYIAEPSLLFGVMCAASLSCLAYQLFWILPYTAMFKVQVPQSEAYDSQDSISIMTSNVLMTNRQYGRLLDVVEDADPDILVTLETDQHWQDAISSLKTKYTFNVERPIDNLYGMHLFSKLELRNVEVKEMIEEGVPSIHCEVQLRNSTWVKCHFLHPAPPSPTENTESTERDHELSIIAKKVRSSSQPTIVTGDLNDVAWSPTTRNFRHVSRLLDPRIGRGMFNTFHADHKFIRWPLDHLFHSTEFELVTITRLPSIGSDHFPLYTKLAFIKQ